MKISIEGIRESFIGRPLRIREKIFLTDPESFIYYYEKHATDRTVIFCDDPRRTISAVFDYSLRGSPAWGQHIADMKMDESEEYTTWKNNNENKTMTNRELVSFVETNIDDVDGSCKHELVAGILNDQPGNFTLRLNAFKHCELFPLLIKLQKARDDTMFYSLDRLSVFEQGCWDNERAYIGETLGAGVMNGVRL